MKSNDEQGYVHELLKAWHKEQASERVYRDLAAHESNPERSKVLLKLADAERRHGEQWTRLLEALDALPPAYHETRG